MSSARRKLFNSRHTCPVEVNGHACQELSPPPEVSRGRGMHCGCDQVNANPATRSHHFAHVKTPPSRASSVGTGAEPQSELASANFGFELVDFPDSLFERHASFDEKLFELRRQPPDQIAVSCE